MVLSLLRRKLFHEPCGTFYNDSVRSIPAVHSPHSGCCRIDNFRLALRFLSPLTDLDSAWIGIKKPAVSCGGFLVLLERSAGYVWLNLTLASVPIPLHAETRRIYGVGNGGEGPACSSLMRYSRWNPNVKPLMAYARGRFGPAGRLDRNAGRSVLG